MTNFKRKRLRYKREHKDLGFNWGDLGLACMGIHASPFFRFRIRNKKTKQREHKDLGFNWGDLGLYILRYV